MSANQVALSYLLASVLFILALKGLSHPETARRGNIFGIAGMAIAVLTTLSLAKSVGLIVGGIAIGGTVGAVVAKRIQMTSMPELVAAMHSLVGLAAVLIAIAVVNNPSAFGLAEAGAALPPFNRIELYAGAFVGAITFTGSVIAFGKLAGLGKKFILFRSAPVVYKGQHLINLALTLAMVGCGVWFFASPSWLPFLIMVAVAFALGVLMIIPIGGADMPVVVSILNSYSGWAAAGIGFSLNNSMLIIAGSLVGSSGAILSYIMCRAMNRSFVNVLLGGYGAEPGAAAAGGEEGVEKAVKSGSPDDAVFLMKNAETVVIVPGYGLAVARAQHALQEMAELLQEHGVNVRYAIHPVAGRMPGHMNVLLAEAEVPYEQVFEMDEINNDFSNTDVVLVIGANDVVNPLAKVPGSPIFGMPILEAHRAKTVIVNKRSMATGYAGLDNELFYMDKTMMVFGDAKKVVEEMVKALAY